MNLAEHLTEIMDSDLAEMTADRLAEIYVTSIQAMTFCTVLAHKKASQLHAAARHNMPAMEKWLSDYSDEYENPLKDIDEFHRRLILKTRDETEKFLGVSREQLQAKARELMDE